MNIISAEQDNIDLMLTQLGANVKSIHGLVCFVKFEIDNTEILYVYNINAKQQFYLQKVLPYPVGAGIFTKPGEIIDYIKKDIAYYKTASKSTVFNDFIDINMELHHIIHNMEETFMHYNVPHEKLHEVEQKLQEINSIVLEMQSSDNAL